MTREEAIEKEKMIMEFDMNIDELMGDEYFHLYKTIRGAKWRMRFKLSGSSVTIETWEQHSPNQWKMLTDSVKTREFARGYWDQLVIDGWRTDG